LVARSSFSERVRGRLEKSWKLEVEAAKEVSLEERELKEARESMDPLASW